MYVWKIDQAHINLMEAFQPDSFIMGILAFQGYFF